MEEKNIDTEVLEMSPKTSPEKLKQIKELQAKKDAIMLRPDLEEGQAIRTAAKEAGESVSAFVLNSVRGRMAGAAKGAYTVDLGAELGERTAMMAKAKEATIEEYVRNAVTEQRKRDIQAFGNIEFGKRSKDKSE